MHIDRREARMPARRGWEEEVWECGVHRLPSCVQLLGPAFVVAYLVVVEDTQADRAVADSPEAVAGTGQAAVGLGEDIDHVAAEAVVGCEAAAVRRHLLKVSQATARMQ